VLDTAAAVGRPQTRARSPLPRRLPQAYGLKYAPSVTPEATGRIPSTAIGNLLGSWRESDRSEKVSRREGISLRWACILMGVGVNALAAVMEGRSSEERRSRC